jgi:antitoxin component of MazEF toxin-antitoxin module
MKLKLRKIGNSYGVIFPKEDIEEFIEAEEIEVEIIYPEHIIVK